MLDEGEQTTQVQRRLTLIWCSVSYKEDEGKEQTQVRTERYQYVKSQRAIMCGQHHKASSTQGFNWMVALEFRTAARN